jgi:hypothetical protein
MKYCANCGKEMADNDTVCAQCGAPAQKTTANYIDDASPTTAKPDEWMESIPEPPVYLSNYAGDESLTRPSSGGWMYEAIAGFIVSLVGLLLYPFILGIVAVVLGIVSLRKFKQMQQRGKGLAIAGIVIGAVDLIYYALSLFVAGLIFY